MTPTTRLVMGIVWFVFVGACFATICSWVRRLWLLRRRGQSAIARIVRCQLDQSGEGHAWFSTFAFVNARGTEISVRRNLSTARFQEGQTVRIIYDAEQPDRLRVVDDHEVGYFVVFVLFTLVQASAVLFFILKA